jgi:1,4-alpha-glucan branching enzyme
MGNGGVVQASAEATHGHPASISLTIPPLATIMLTPAGF